MISVEAIIATFMSILEKNLHVEKTLNTTTQKNLPKSQKFAWKISAAEFGYSQTILLRFTVIFLVIPKLMIL